MYDAWGPQEIVDGAGRTLPEHAAALAATLVLSQEQASILVAELRNALLPATVNDKHCRKGIERVFALADAVAARSRHGHDQG